MSRRTKKRMGFCCYCGFWGEMTRDHVIPRCMLQSSDNTNIIVPACRPCNNAKSQLDPIVRFFSAVTPGSNAPERIIDLSIGSLKHIYKKVLPILSSVYPSQYISSEGISHGEHLAFEIPVAFKMGIVMMIFGLHYHSTGRRLPIHSIKSFDTSMPSNQAALYSLECEDVCFDEVTVGKTFPVVHARNRYLKTDRLFGLWEITLYGDATCIVSTSNT